MKTGMKQMKCGACGEGHFRIYHKDYSSLFAECVNPNCGCTTEIKPTVVTLQLTGDDKGGLATWDEE